MNKKALFVFGICAAVFCIVFAAGCVGGGQTENQAQTPASPAEGDAVPTPDTNPSDFVPGIFLINDPIVGKWVYNMDSNPEFGGTHACRIMEFFPDGTAIMAAEFGTDVSDPLYFQWIKTDENEYAARLMAEYEDFGEPFRIADGNQLIFGSGDGPVFIKSA